MRMRYVWLVAAIGLFDVAGLVSFWAQSAAPARAEVSTTQLTACVNASAPCLRGPVEAADPTRTDGTVNLGSLDAGGRLRVNTRPAVSTPGGALVSQVATGGTAVTLLAAGAMAAHGWSVCDIVNPPGTTTALYVDFIGTATAGAATSIPIPAAGGTYRISRPISTAVSAVSSDSAHPVVMACY